MMSGTAERLAQVRDYERGRKNAERSEAHINLHIVIHREGRPVTLRGTRLSFQSENWDGRAVVYRI